MENWYNFHTLNGNVSSPGCHRTFKVDSASDDDDDEFIFAPFNQLLIDQATHHFFLMKSANRYFFLFWFRSIYSYNLMMFAIIKMMNKLIMPSLAHTHTRHTHKTIADIFFLIVRPRLCLALFRCRRRHRHL